MATDLEQLQTIKSQILQRIVEITASPKPSYKTATGQSVDWNGYLKSLREQLQEINKILVAEDPMYVETQLFTPDEPLA